MSDEYNIRSVPPRYDEYSSYYVHTSEGYGKAVEEIEAEERETVEAEISEETQKQILVEDQKKADQFNREEDKRILEEIRRKEKALEAQTVEVSEYSEEEELPSGTRLDLLA